MTRAGLLSWLGSKPTTRRDTQDVWSSGLDHEIAWWDEFLATRGMSWPAEFTERLDPATTLSEYHQAFVQHIPGPEVRILDVGAGPLTYLGKTLPNKRLTIVPTDALAPHYDRLLEKHGITPPVRTIHAEAEKLTEVFAENAFDLVNARNSIDHTYDPREAIAQMLRVARPGCYVVLNHAENEAEKQQYVGLHQWNFTMRRGDFVIRSKRGTVNVTRELAPVAVMEYCGRPDGDWLRVHFRKRVG